jgi:hypothetical protein
VSKALAAQSSSGTTGVAAEAKIVQQAASAAPSAIRSDIETLAAAFTTYASALKKAGFKAGSTPSTTNYAALAQALQSLNAPKLRTAEQHVEAWAKKNCSSG